MHVTSAEEQRVVLAELDTLDAVKALVPPEDFQTDDEKRLFELVNGANSENSGSLNDLDGGLAEPAESLVTESSFDWASLAAAFYETEPGRLAILAVACAAATLVLSVVVGLVYLKHLVTRSFNVAAEVLPQVEKRSLPAPDSHIPSEKPSLLLIDVTEPAPGPIITTEEFSEKIGLLDDDYDSSSDSEDDEDFDEKFHDAESGVPQIVVDACPDPDLLPLPLRISRSPTPYSTPPHTPPRPLRKLPSQLQMREANLSATKPAWSLRAADAPALGLASSPAAPPMRTVSPVMVSRSSSEVPPIPGAFESDDEKAVAERPARRRAYRAPVPELDIAFALQMRPGLGLGSDPAWLVRFMMAMFGWMTVLIGGNGVRSRQDRWAIDV